MSSKFKNRIVKKRGRPVNPNGDYGKAKGISETLDLHKSKTVKVESTVNFQSYLATCAKAEGKVFITESGDGTVNVFRKL